MTYDLRQESWIPWRRRSGAVEWGPPAKLLDDLEGDCVIGVATPRPDFDGALQEFLIGLLTVALLPADDDEWERISEEAPTPSMLREALDRLPPAFDLEGDGPRFFQDLSAVDLDDASIVPIEKLFIETPGDQTQKLNKDHFVKRDRIERLGRPAAALALLTMQTYAPAGGAGHRTSLRGGGPLTTLVDPRIDSKGRSLAQDRPLWEKLWANVETKEALRAKPSSGPLGAVDAAFPWLRPTRTSNAKGAGGETPPSAAHPLEAYFGLPRRIRLEFGGAGRCGLADLDDERTVVGFRMKNYGVQYVGWEHPLSPHYRPRATNTEWLPVHGQPGGISWRDWVGLALQSGADELHRAAPVVPAYTRRAGFRAGAAAQLHVFGYDMDNMKARGWTESSLPLFIVADEARRQLMHQTAQQLAEATGIAGAALLYEVKAARHEKPKEVAGDIGYVRTELWGSTEADFYRMMGRLAEPKDQSVNAEGSADALRTEFKDSLRKQTLEVFDRWSPTPGLAPEALRRRVLARHDLVSTLNGYTKLGEKLFAALGVPLPGGGRSARATRKRTHTESAQ